MTHMIIKENGIYYRLSEKGIQRLQDEEVPKAIIEKYFEWDRQQELKKKGYIVYNKKEKRQRLKQQRRNVVEKRLFRIVVEKHIGRKLLNKEHIHHLDCDKGNNDISNLLITDPVEHRKLHGQLNRLLKQDLNGLKIVFDMNERVYKAIQKHEKLIGNQTLLNIYK